MGETGEHAIPKSGELSREISRGLVNYPSVVAEAQRATELIERLRGFIDMINEGGLPAGHMIRTRSVSSMPVSLTPAKFLEPNPGPPHRGTIVYRPDESGNYRPDGELATLGSREIFLGDRIFVDDDNNLVIINSDLGVGVTPNGEVDIVDITDQSPQSEGGHAVRMFTGFMSMVDKIRDGKTEAFDCSYF